jgi:hypothetical protein
MWIDANALWIPSNPELCEAGHRLSRRDSGALFCHPQQLLLIKRNAERRLQNGDKQRTGIGDRLLTLPPSQAKIGHAALYWAGTDDCNLGGEIVEDLRLIERQRRHLRATFDLKHSDGVSFANRAPYIDS